MKHVATQSFGLAQDGRVLGDSECAARFLRHLHFGKQGHLCDVILLDQITQYFAQLCDVTNDGVPILKALQTAAHTLSNSALRANAMQAIELVREGAPLGSALAQNKRLPGLLSMFARLGEQTGQLPHMLQHAADHLSEEVQRRAMQLATILEPLLIVTMGVVVMLIVLAVMLPIIQLNQFVR
jgi:general secretion pathway protein F